MSKTLAELPLQVGDLIMLKPHCYLKHCLSNFDFFSVKYDSALGLKAKNIFGVVWQINLGHDIHMMHVIQPNTGNTITLVNDSKHTLKYEVCRRIPAYQSFSAIAMYCDIFTCFEVVSRVDNNCSGS